MLKKGDATTKVIGLAIAGIFAGSRLMKAVETAKATGGDSNKPTAGDEKKDKAAAESDKHVCKGMNACKGQGGCKTGDGSCAGKNSCKGHGGCAVPVKKAA